jgi:hypothetical protein
MPTNKGNKIGLKLDKKKAFCSASDDITAVFISFLSDDVFIISLKNPQEFIHNLETGEFSIDSITTDNIDSKTTKLFMNTLIKTCETTPSSPIKSSQSQKITEIKHMKLDQLIPESIIAIAGTAVGGGTLGQSETGSPTECTDCG